MVGRPHLKKPFSIKCPMDLLRPDYGVFYRQLLTNRDELLKKYIIGNKSELQHRWIESTLISNYLKNVNVFFRLFLNANAQNFSPATCLFSSTS